MLKLKDSKIAQDWSALLPECAGEGPGLIEMVQHNLTAYQVPGMSWKLESAATSLLKGMLGNRRDFLAIRNKALSEWLVCIGAHDYGRFLSVVWYLTTSPRFLNKIRGAASGSIVLTDLDVFGQQDLSAYSSATLMAVQDGVQELVQRRELDIEQLNRKTSGLFAVA